MQTSVLIRLMLVLGLVAVGGYVLTPTVIYFSMTDAELAEVQKDTANFKNHLPSWSPESHIVPGLDLQGGVHMVLGVDGGTRGLAAEQFLSNSFIDNDVGIDSHADRQQQSRDARQRQ